MAESIKVLVPEEEVDARIRALGEQISKDYEGKQIHLICVLKGESFSCVNWQRELRYRFPWTLCAWEATETEQSPAV